MKPAGHFVFSRFVASLSHGHLIHLPVFFNQKKNGGGGGGGELRDKFYGYVG